LLSPLIRQQDPLHTIINEGVTTTLLAISKESNWLIVEQSSDENMIGHVRALPRAVYRKEAQDGEGQRKVFLVGPAQMLGPQLCNAIRRTRHQRRFLITYCKATIHG